MATEIVGENWPGLVWDTFGLARQLRRGDLLLAPANLLPPNWFGPTVLIAYDTLLWSDPGRFPWHIRWRFGWRYRLAARRATRVVVPSEATAQDVSRFFQVPPDRIRVIYPGPDPSFRPLPDDGPEVRSARREVGVGDRPYFLFVGKRSARRNVPSILAAFRAHRARWPEHRLVFVGPTGGDTLPHDDPGVIDAGHVSEPTLHGLLAGATALLYPSEHEGFGLPVVEAMACGCPVVTLSTSALRESAGDAAYILEAPDPAAIGRAMQRLVEEPALTDALVTKGLGHARRFRRDAFAGEINGVIREVAALGSNPSR